MYKCKTILFHTKIGENVTLLYFNLYTGIKFVIKYFALISFCFV